MLQKKYLLQIFVLIILFINIKSFSQTLAFPGAEGSGRFSKGGRFGEVYEVTNLNNSGPGSIVDAVSKPNRTIVFRVSGTIELGNNLLRPKSNTTIAGQTAPGDGICIKGRIYINASNVIIRFIRVRVDAGAANSSGDAIDIAGGKNIIIDHVTASYSRDEGISCQETSDSVTVQWCIISEALTFENHSYGSLIRGDYGDQKTYHHNLYAHNNNRLPRPGNYTEPPTDTIGLFFDFRNNVVYNWKGSYPGYNADTKSISRYNFIGNVYIPGPESSPTGIAFKESSYNSYGYFENNMYNGSIPSNQWSLVQFGFTDPNLIAAYKARSAPIPMAPVRTTTPQQALEEVLSKSGACFPKRDIIDQRIINDVINRTGHSIAVTAEQPEGGWPKLESLPAPLDSDHDGMPDDWEIQHGLNPNNPDDRNIVNSDGYTNLEVYLNSLVESVVITDIKKNESSLPMNFELKQNYPNPFNPTTNIEFSIPSSGYVKLEVYDLLGRKISTLINEFKNSGYYNVKFDGSNLNSGIYIYSLYFNDKISSKKMLLIK